MQRLQTGIVGPLQRWRANNGQLGRRLGEDGLLLPPCLASKASLRYVTLWQMVYGNQSSLQAWCAIAWTRHGTRWWGKENPWEWGMETANMWRVVRDLEALDTCHSTNGFKLTDERSLAVLLPPVRPQSRLEHARYYWSICGCFKVRWSWRLERRGLFDDWRIDHDWHPKPNWIQVRSKNSSKEDLLTVSLCSFWALFASPLIVTTDVRDMSDKAHILLNQEVIAVNQDPVSISLYG